MNDKSVIDMEHARLTSEVDALKSGIDSALAERDRVFSLAAARRRALKDALKWALEEVRILAGPNEAPDSPYWNDYRHARAALEGRDPDEDGGP